jgi:hypothetical protein
MHLDPQRGACGFQSEYQRGTSGANMLYRVSDQFGDEEDRRVLQMGDAP